MPLIRVNGGSNYRAKKSSAKEVKLGEEFMTFAMYLIGFVVFVVGVALGAYYLNVPTKWIVVMVITLTGLGILSGAKVTRHRNPSV
jgi:uncharacterized membrane protein YiaA